MDHASPSVLAVTVASGQRRIDLVLPSALPVAELVPELARGLGLLGPVAAADDLHLLTPGGRRLVPDAGLAAQGVADGGVLLLVTGSDALSAPVHDDLAEAVGDAVERLPGPWQRRATRRTALTLAALVVTLGAVALLTHPAAGTAAAASCVMGGALAAAGVAASRGVPVSWGGAGSAAAVTLAWLAVGHAVVIGLRLAPEAPGPLAEPPTAAAVGAFVAGVAAMTGLRRGRVLLLPAAALGALGVGGGVVLDAVGPGGAILGVAVPWPAVPWVAVLATVVLTGGLAPRLALVASGVRSAAGPEELDPDDLRTAQEILVALQTTRGLLLVLLAPAAVHLGVAGALLAAACCGVVLLGARRHRSGPVALVAVASGLLGLLSTGAAVAVLHEQWRAGLGVALTLAALLLVVDTLRPVGSLPRRARLGDLAEAVCLASVLPLLVVASGLLAVVG